MINKLLERKNKNIKYLANGLCSINEMADLFLDIDFYICLFTRKFNFKYDKYNRKMNIKY